MKKALFVFIAGFATLTTALWGMQKTYRYECSNCHRIIETAQGWKAPTCCPGAIMWRRPGN